MLSFYAKVWRLLWKLRKVGIIGTGHVGSHVAFSLALQGEG